MAKISKMPRGEQGLNFRCGGYVEVDGSLLRPGDAESEAILVLEDRLLIPCSAAIALSLGVRGRIDLKHLRRHLENFGWLIAHITPEAVEGDVPVHDPLCPRHGALLAADLMQSPGTSPAVAQKLQEYLDHAGAAMQEPS